jgi:REP element-mobilizing transposase RayT
VSDPLAYFLTWTTYGSWLPGDERGWVDRWRRHGEIVDKPEPLLEKHARELLKGPAVTLDQEMRTAAEAAMRGATDEFGWMIHALAVRSNHVHLVVSARDKAPGKVMGLLKRRGTQTLNGLNGNNNIKRWWTEDGSKRLLYTEEAVARAVEYVKNQ